MLHRSRIIRYFIFSSACLLFGGSFLASIKGRIGKSSRLNRACFASNDVAVYPPCHLSSKFIPVVGCLQYWSCVDSSPVAGCRAVRQCALFCLIAPIACAQMTHWCLFSADPGRVSHSKRCSSTSNWHVSIQPRVSFGTVGSFRFSINVGFVFWFVGRQTSM